MPNRIKLDAMHERHRALTPSLAGTYQEAACVCLSRNHTSPVEVTISDNGTKSPAEFAWAAPDSRVLDAWANTTDATEALHECANTRVHFKRDSIDRQKVFVAFHHIAAVDRFGAFASHSGSGAPEQAISTTGCPTSGIPEEDPMAHTNRGRASWVVY